MVEAGVSVALLCCAFIAHALLCFPLLGFALLCFALLCSALFCTALLYSAFLWVGFLSRALAVFAPLHVQVQKCLQANLEVQLQYTPGQIKCIFVQPSGARKSIGCKWA